MEILNARIEERLIHGQVVTVWVPFLRPSRIIVIDNDTAKNDFQKKALKMACPQGVKLSIFGVDRAIERLAENPYGDEKVFMLFKNPANVKEFIDKGYPLKEVNVGNMSGKDNTTQVKKAVSVSHEEAEMFREMHAKGVNFTALMVPTDADVNFMQLIENI